MADLAIVVTCPGEEPYVLWSMVAGNTEWTRFEVAGGPTDCRSLDIAENGPRVVVLCHPLTPEDKLEQQKQTTEWLLSLLQDDRLAEYEAVHVAVHRGRADWGEVMEEVAGRVLHHVEFDHEPSDCVYAAMLGFCRHPSLKTFSSLVEGCEASKEVTMALRIRQLKHDIGNSLRSFELELQGWSNAGFDVPYWDEIVQAWSGELFASKLDRVRSLVYGGDSESDSVERVLMEVGKLGVGEHEECIGLWETIQQLLPNCDNAIDEANERTQLYNNAMEFGQLVQSCDASSVRRLLESARNNNYKRWLVELIGSLDRLAEAVSDHKK